MGKLSSSQFHLQTGDRPIASLRTPGFQQLFKVGGAVQPSPLLMPSWYSMIRVTQGRLTFSHLRQHDVFNAVTQY